METRERIIELVYDTASIWQNRADVMANPRMAARDLADILSIVWEERNG